MGKSSKKHSSEAAAEDGQIDQSNDGQQPSASSEFDRFRSLTKRLLSVPKKEIEEQAKKAQRKS